MARATCCADSPAELITASTVELSGVGAAEAHAPAIRRARVRRSTGVSNAMVPPRASKIALQRQHVGVAIDDAGRGRDQRGDAIERRFDRAGRIAAEEFEPLDPVDLALRRDGFDLGGLHLVSATMNLPQLAVRHAVASRRSSRAGDGPRTQSRTRRRAGRVIHAGMDHLAVARGNAVADAVGRFRDDRLVTGKRGSPRERKADHARTDDQNLHRLPGKEN